MITHNSNILEYAAICCYCFVEPHSRYILNYWSGQTQPGLGQYWRRCAASTGPICHDPVSEGFQSPVTYLKLVYCNGIVLQNDPLVNPSNWFNQFPILLEYWGVDMMRWTSSRALYGQNCRLATTCSVCMCLCLWCFPFLFSPGIVTTTCSMMWLPHIRYQIW